MRKTEQIELLIEQNKALQVQIQAHQAQMQVQEKKLEELLRVNAEILINTEKMAKHIDFINRAYDKISKSYFLKNILG